MNKKIKVAIIDRFLFWDFLGPFLFFISSLIIVGMVDVIFVYVDWFVNQGVSLPVVFKLLLFKIPSIMVLFSPMAVLFSTMLVFGRLAKDSELVVLRTSGVHLLRIVLPVVLTGFFLSLLTFFINEKIVPWSNHKSEIIVRQMILKNPLPQIQQNIFFNAGANRYFYLRSLNPKTKEFEGIMIYELSWTGYPKLITAKKGYYRDRHWFLEGGILHDFDTKGHLVCESSFETMEINFDRDFSSFFSDVKSTLEMNSEELKKQIKNFKKSSISTRHLEVDLALKQAAPFTNLIFLLIGVGLATNFVRSQRDFWGIIIAVGIAVLGCGFFFFNMAAFRALGRAGVLPPFLAGWGPNFLFGLAAVFLILKEGLTR